MPGMEKLKHILKRFMPGMETILNMFSISEI